MNPKIFLVFGASGRTGQHFVTHALNEGHKVKALVRSPDKIPKKHANLQLLQGSITEYNDLDGLLAGADSVVMMLGDAELQSREKINALFIKKLVPAMRRQGVKRLLYQAGGLTRRYKERLPLVPWLLRNTLARAKNLIGQHEDNEGVIAYLVEEAKDLDWIVHRASIISDGESKGMLKRSKTRNGLATFGDCAIYNYNLLSDTSAIHTYDLSCY